MVPAVLCDPSYTFYFVQGFVEIGLTTVRPYDYIKQSDDLKRTHLYTKTAQKFFYEQHRLDSVGGCGTVLLSKMYKMN